MKHGRDIEARGTFLRSMDGPRVHEYVNVFSYKAGEDKTLRDGKVSPPTVVIGMEHAGDWYNSVELSPAAARRFCDAIDKAIARVAPTEEEA